MARKGGKSLFSLSTILASFFGAAMIAGAFAYFNYKFSEYKFIDFHKWQFYQKSKLFGPQEDRYIVVFYSSRNRHAQEYLSKLSLKYPVLAIDYYNTAQKQQNSTLFLRAGTNTTLKFIQRFNIYDSPSLFFIKRIKDTLYKQDSMIRKLDNLKELSQAVEKL